MVFQVGGELYGVEIRAIREVVPAHTYRVTPVPRTPAHICGVTNLRGRVIPVADLRTRLGLLAGGTSKDTRIAVAEGGLGTVGLVVDGVSEVLRVRPDEVEPSPVGHGVDAELVTGVAKVGERLVTLLDLERVLAREERTPGLEGGPYGTGI